jgi:hypothetical protein
MHTKFWLGFGAQNTWTLNLACSSTSSSSSSWSRFLLSFFFGFENFWSSWIYYCVSEWLVKVTTLGFPLDMVLESSSKESRGKKTGDQRILLWFSGALSVGMWWPICHMRFARVLHRLSMLYLKVMCVRACFVPIWEFAFADV